MRVKICGITSLKDACFTIDAGADALGFVFYEKSPRYVEPHKAKTIINNLPPFVDRVGLFVNSSPKEINATCKNLKLTIAQLHFDVDDIFLKKIDYPYLRVVRAKTKEDILQNRCNFRLIDAYSDSFGGVGKKLDISWFNDIDTSKIILAGGLNINNIDEVKKYDFYGVDVSSGVETSPGIKDLQKVKDFIEKVKY